MRYLPAAAAIALIWITTVFVAYRAGAAEEATFKVRSHENHQYAIDQLERCVNRMEQTSALLTEVQP